MIQSYRSMWLCVALSSIVSVSALTNGRKSGMIDNGDARSSAHFSPGIWTAREAVPVTPNSSVLIQISKITYSEIKSSNFSVYVLDAHRAMFTVEEVEELKAANKTLLAYLSLGAAEIQRPYWQPFWSTDLPDFFISPSAPESAYTGKYRVKFWKPQWQRLVLRFMREQILRFGFNGLYLDNLDVYQYFADEPHDNIAEIISFIRLARNQALVLSPGTLIVASNVPELYELASFRGVIDGLSVTDTWFQNDTDLSRTNPRRLEAVLKQTRQAKRDGKMVLAVDFPTRTETVCAFYDNCMAEDFTCGVTDNALTGVNRICVRQTSQPWDIVIKNITDGDKKPSSTGAPSPRTSTTASRATRLVMNFLIAFLLLITTAMC